MAKFRLIILILFLLVLITLFGCSHSSYTESTTNTFVFHYGDTVQTSEECSSGKSFINKCGHSGTVIAYDERKSNCYPQPQYLVDTIIDNKHQTFKYCANELLLVEGESHGRAN